MLWVLFGGSAQWANAAQSGNFTYTDYGSYVVITDFPETVAGAVVIPSSINGKPVKMIGQSAFMSCNQITSVAFPAGLTRIGEDAFRFCTGLTGPLTLPAGLTLVESHAFAYCSGITSISIPASLTGMGVSAFAPCDGLQSFSVNAGNPYYKSTNGVLFQKLDSILVQYPPARNGAYTIPSGTTQVGPNAFFSCGGLTGVKIPSSLTILGDDAFHGCSGLTSVTLPASITSIGARCFSYSLNLQSVSIPSSVTSIGTYAFANCYSLASATIPASVTSLGLGPFSTCSSLTSIAVAAGNPQFVSVDGVVFNTAKTKLIQFPTERAGSYAVPANVTEIYDNSFAGSLNLTSVRLPAGLEKIGSAAFFLCPELTDIPLPTGLATIGSSAFWSCRSLTGVRIPSSVTALGTYAYYGCSLLGFAEFRGNAPAMGSGVFSGAAGGFEVFHFNGSTGFTTPTWQGYKAVNLGDFIPLPQEIAVEDSVGNDLKHTLSTGSFGNVTIGGSAARIFTIRNSGESDLTGIAATILGADSAEFQLSAIGAATLQEGDSTTFQLTFSPAAAGARVVTVRISSNDEDESPFEFDVTGIGAAPRAPEIDVMQPVGSKLADGKSKKSFGTVKIGNKGAAKTFTITNTGTARLTGLVITRHGSHAKDFIITQPAKSALAPGGSTTFKVVFKPTDKGTRSAALRLKSNDGNENPFDIKLSGMGVR